MSKQQRIMKWLNVFLLIINLSTFLTIMLMNKGKASPSAEGSKFSSDDFLRKELILSKEQFQTLNRLDGDVFRSYQVLLDKQCELNFAILDELASENPSKTDLDSLASRVGHYQYLLKKQTVRHFLNVRSICTEDQQVLLNNLLHSMMGTGDKCSVCNKRDCERRDQIKK